MTELDRIAEQLRSSFEGPAWHGPAVLEALAGFGPVTARARPIVTGHTAWELLFHLGGTYGLVLRRLQGDGRQLAPEQDWPTAPLADADAWHAAVRDLHARNEELRQAVRQLDPARLDLPLVPDPPYTAYTQFIGITQHDLYHAGQLALLKRALGL